MTGRLFRMYVFGLLCGLLLARYIGVLNTSRHMNQLMDAGFVIQDPEGFEVGRWVEL